MVNRRLPQGQHFPLSKIQFSKLSITYWSTITFLKSYWCRLSNTVQPCPNLSNHGYFLSNSVQPHNRMKFLAFFPPLSAWKIDFLPPKICGLSRWKGGSMKRGQDDRRITPRWGGYGVSCRGYPPLTLCQKSICQSNKSAARLIFQKIGESTL